MTTDVPTYLDGNAAAGMLGELFAVDITAAIGQCNGCGRTGSSPRPASTWTLLAWSPAAVVATTSCSAW